MSGRVLFLTSNYPRWAGDSTTPFVLNLASDLAAEGWEAHVLAPHAPGCASDEVLGGVPVHRFRYAVPEGAETVCYGGGALVNLRRRPIERLKLPAFAAAEWAAAARATAGGAFDLIHAHWILPQGLIAGLLPNRVPAVITVHGGDVFGLQGPGMATLKRWSIRRASAVTVNSSATRQATVELLGHDRGVEQIPMGADVSEPRPGQVAAIRAVHRDSGPLLVFVGRLVEEKGLGDLIDAVRELQTSHPGVRLIVLGEGQDRGRFEAQAAQLPGAPVRFLGWVDPSDVGAHLAAADVFVGPSRTGPDGWTEGQGLTMIESMMAGTPVVATRSGGIVDSIEDERTGLLVDESAPTQIAAAVRRLVDDPSLADRLTAAAADDATARFSRPASARRFAELFDRLTN